MNKDLKRFYVFFIIALITSINFFPNIFFNINNTINYFKVKTEIILKKESNYETIIDNDKGNVIIMLDDGWKTQYDIAFKYMSKHNMIGSIAIITNVVNDINYVNIGDLHDLYRNNWDLLNHTANHLNSKKSNLKEQKANIEIGGNGLSNHGFINNQKVLVYPYGYYNNDTVSILKNLNIVSGRSVNDGFNPQYIKDFYDIKLKNVVSNTNPKVVNKWIDEAAEKKLTLILLFHKLESVTDSTLMQYNVKDFYNIIDYLNQVRNKVNIITYSDWISASLFFNYSK
ncbi:MAG: polysaccharide deacetylase family protein [Bacilli bacterium]|nr:polysaccharide deacetylase family protein [Bacilli bacterium]